MSRSHTIRVRVTKDELAEIRKAAAFRDMGLSEHVRERASTITISCGLEALATMEDVKDAVRAFFESFDAQKAAHASWMAVEDDGSPEADAAWRAYRDARSVYEAARARAREVAR